MLEEKIVFNTEDVNNNKAYGILAYIGFLFLIPLFVAKDSQYAKFHTNQGLVLFLVEIVLNVAVSIVNFMLRMTIVLIPVAVLLNVAVGAVGLVFMVLGIINACSGEPKTLPLIGSITLLK